MRTPSILRAALALIMAMLLGMGSLVAPAMAQESTPGATPATVIPVESPEVSTPEAPVSTPEIIEPEPSPVIAPSPMASPQASPVAISGTVDLDVLFVGGQPDDESGGLSTYGQWNEYNNVEVGVITVTRGEGGGNAAGTEEGPALGLIREAEERTAVGMANVDHIYNLDKVDFYYTVSAELAAETWGYDDTLEKVVRVIRTTQPEIIITMNPAPTPGQHGHHQMAGRLAIDAFYSAADPNAFPEQITDEGLSTWRASRIMRSGASGEAQPGPQCAETYQPAESTDVIYGVWSGTESEANGTTWAAVERAAQQSYVSQGWGAFPDVSDNPDELGCDYFTLIDSRAPFDPENTSPTAILEGVVLSAEGGLPLGTEFYLTTSEFDVAAGEPFEVSAHLRPAQPLTDPTVSISVPDGWDMTNPDAEPVEGEDGDLEWTVQVTPGADAESNTRFRIDASVSSAEGDATTTEVVEVVADVTGTLEPLPEVAYFREWVDEVDVPQLDSLIFPVFSMGAGQTRDITIDLTNTSGDMMSGSVSLDLPEGFSAEPVSQDFADLAADGTDQVMFSVTNDDPSLPTSNEGGDEGNYLFTITTITDTGSSTEDAGINLVPVTTVPEAATPPAIDGQISDGEYTGEALDLSRIWEGQPLDGPEDASGMAYVTWGDDGIYIAVDVSDDVLGTVLPQNDAKRHWRTDSVEIAIDPLGTASNTSTTFKVGVFPTTEGAPAAYRDADAHQGPVAETAPGFELASTVSEPYTGYTIEVMIPYDVLPADIDPDNATMNIFIYDSDTQDLTGQTRLGWSTWRGVQGDPYRWGKTIYEGYTPPADARTTPDDPIMPLDAAQSVNSPLSILQAARDGVGLAGNPQVPEGEGIEVDSVSIVNGEQEIRFTAHSNGTVHVFSYVDGMVVGEYSDAVSEGASRSYGFPTTDGDDAYILISFVDDQGRVQAIAEAVE